QCIIKSVIKSACENHFKFNNDGTQQTTYTVKHLVVPKRRKALLIGINYFKTKFELKGCLNDVENMKRFLMELYNFPEENMLILTDDPKQRDPSKIPTRANILKGMKWLVHDSQPGDSGHGGQVEDKNGDEVDGYDETIMPLDFERKGQIIDDDMHNIMVRPLKE
ncbi:24563_t:CDS:2, partial [Gigaspora rosea]